MEGPLNILHLENWPLYIISLSWLTMVFFFFFLMWQCRLRGKIDSSGCVSAFLEERLNMGLNFILSAEVKLLGILCTRLTFS